ncbi:MAG: hypothetical protein GC168_12275 [Candidatus Hydrogenedens sp.]|nr:hypothetical protein [Candidatus Hydrogenedens sp.]
MTFFAARFAGPASPVWFVALYWLAWLVSLGVAIYCVLLDLRYIRAAFLLEERDLYRDTLGSEEFRQAMYEAQREYQQERQDSGGSGKS